MSGPCFVADEDGVHIAVRVTPRAKKSGFAGLTEGADGRTRLAIRLAAPPVDGAANKALVAWLADEFDRPKSAVRILSGKHGREKQVRIAGLCAEAFSRWLESHSD